MSLLKAFCAHRLPTPCLRASFETTKDSTYQIVKHVSEICVEIGGHLKDASSQTRKAVSITRDRCTCLSTR